MNLFIIFYIIPKLKFIIIPLKRTLLHSLSDGINSLALGQLPCFFLLLPLTLVRQYFKFQSLDTNITQDIIAF